MATLLELLSNLSEDQMREGESITVVDGSGRQTTITFGARQELEVSTFERFLIPTSL